MKAEVKERKRESGREGGETEWRKSEFNRAKGHINPYVHLSMGKEVRGKDLKFTRNCAKFRKIPTNEHIATTLTSPV